MSQRRWISVFSSAQEVLAGVSQLRREGFAIEDVQTPFAVHGLDEAVGLRRSRLGWVCAVMGLLAAAAMFGFEHWVSAVDWPINVGGKPLSSTPAFVPVMFEVGVLAAGLSTVFAFLVVTRLYPGKKPKLAHPGVTDDRFVVVFEAPGGGMDSAEAQALRHRLGALEVTS